MENGNESDSHTDLHVARYSVEENISMCQFLHSRTHDPSDGLLEKFREDPNKKKFWENFRKETKTERTASSLVGRFPKLMKKLHKVPISVEMKLDLYYSLSHPIHENFIREAKKSAHLALDSDRNIEAFEMKPEEEHVEKEANILKKRKSSMLKENDSGAPEAKRGFKKFTKEENVSMWKFLLEKIIDPETGIVRKDEHFRPSSEKLWSEFGETIEQPRPAKSYSAHYKMMPEKLHEMPLDLRMKTDLHFGLRIPVNPELLETMKQTFKVRTDENGCITEYL